MTSKMIELFTEEELEDIQRYEFILNSKTITESIKEKLKLTPPPKYFDYLKTKTKLN